MCAEAPEGYTPATRRQGSELLSEVDGVASGSLRTERRGRAGQVNEHHTAQQSAVTAIDIW